MARSGTILVVEDEPDIRDLLVFRLTQEGFPVRALTDGLTAIREAPTLEPALVILDRMLPGADGDAVCRALRADPLTRATPVLMLSARGASDDRIEGLTAGADDYVAKPFELRELILRVRALLRRGGDPAGPAHQTFEIDYKRRRVFVEGAEVLLSPTEFRLLAALSLAGGQVVSTARLVEAAGNGFDPAALEPTLRRLAGRLGNLGQRLQSTDDGWRF
jgi:DNA-binding response OmpR family regulator